MAFSGALTLTDLNDFITPSQACIKPVEQSNSQPAKDEGAASTQIHIDSSGSYYEVSKENAGNINANTNTSSRKLETAQISLNDCLACSGCITSAESVLITMQSHEEVLSVLSSNPPAICVDHKTPVLSISPQSLASLAASISSTSRSTVTLAQVLHRVGAFARTLGFEHVFDTTFARHLALLEHAREFHERRQGTVGEGDAVTKLPMLASACPGWVCYAEKTHPEMLPFISRTKSPQQVMGTLVKNWLGEKWGKKPDQIYHVTVMPCYDKKLEASRQDFYNDIYSTRDVDCVITTGELEVMMRERAWDLSHPLTSESSLPALATSSSTPVSDSTPDHPSGPEIPALLTHPGSSSGSYLHALLAAQAAAVPGAELTTRQVRGADFEEYVLRAPGPAGGVLFKAARCYGFRNLQNVVRRVGRAAGVQVGRGAAGRLAAVRAKAKRRAGRAKDKDGDAGEGDGEDEERAYDYVEVMACPSGCVNGGGQLRPVLDAITQSEVEAQNLIDVGQPASDARWGDRAWTRRVEQAYWHDLPTPPPSPPLDPKPNLTISTSTSTTTTDPPPKPSSESESGSARLQAADTLALCVLADLCLSPSLPSPNSAPAPAPLPTSWAHPMEPPAEERRLAAFRTTYRAVISEVAGIQVQW